MPEELPPPPPLPRSTGPGRGRVVPVLLAAGSAPWEAEAVARLSDPGHGVLLLQRCLDLADLLGAAATGTAEVALLAAEVRGLDADSVARLHHSGVRVVVVADPREEPSRARLGADALRRLDVDLVLGPEDLGLVAARVREVARETATPDVPDWLRTSAADQPDEPDTVTPQPRDGKLVAVWGAGGAPGRTTLAVALAAEAAHRGHATLLVDADPYGGAVAQQLAVLDEVSGLLGAARLANAGQLDLVRFAGLARALAPGFRVLTGLPRPGRWPEVRPAAFTEVLAAARRLDDLVVVDTGAGIEAGSDDPFDAAPSRDETTRTVLAEADVVVLVAAPDPVGMQRAVRAVTDLADLRPAGVDVVAVNRMRTSVGWDRRDVVGLLHRVAPSALVVFLPDDVVAADRALVAGRTLVESADSALRRATAGLATEVLGVLGLPAAPTVRGVRRRLRRTG